MRALFVQHDHVSPVGPVGARFAERGYAVDEMLVVPEDRFHAPGVATAFPDPTAYDVVVSMGAPWSVYDLATIGPWVEPELDVPARGPGRGRAGAGDLFRRPGAGGGPGRGGRAGATSRRSAGTSVATDEPDLVEAGPWFEWHHDRWVAPPGARVLARTAVAEQAFVLGRSLAVQFHPELTPVDAAGLGRQRRPGLPRPPRRRRGRAARRAPTARPTTPYGRSHRLVDRFLDQVGPRRLAPTRAGAAAPTATPRLGPWQPPTDRPASRYARVAAAADRGSALR